MPINLPSVNWIHSKQGPQVHCVALAPIFSFDRRAMQSSEPSTVPKIQPPRYLCERSCSMQPFVGNRHCIHISSPPAVQGFAGRLPQPLMEDFGSLNLAWSARWCQRAKTLILASVLQGGSASEGSGDEGSHRAGSLRVFL